MIFLLDTTKNDGYYVDADILVTKHKKELLFWGCLTWTSTSGAEFSKKNELSITPY